MLVIPIAASQADSGAWQGDATARARLIAATTATGNSATLTAGLEVELADGWKTYWRSPGDAGLPPMLDFAQSRGLRGASMHFPAPHRFTLFGLETYGYSERVIFPISFALAERGRPLAIVAQLDGLVCSTICIPLSQQLTLALPSGEAKPSPHAQAIAQAIARVPLPRSGNSGDQGARVEAAVLTGDNLIIRLASANGDPLPIHRGDILLEADAGYAFAAPRFVNGAAQIAISGKPPAGLIGTDAMVTVLGDGDMFEETITISAASSGIFIALLAGLLGGLLLNVMPCVLPVLAVKLTSVIGISGAGSVAIRRRFLMTAAGIMGSFGLLGLVLLGLRAGGAAIGWGVQFQNPIFLVLLIAVMLGFALLLAYDRLSLPIPAFATRLAYASSRLTGDIKDIANGGLATLLATPCSAPFLGVAVGFAFVASPIAMLLVFLAMGLGLALPWLVIAGKPDWVAYLPKPGAWLAWVRPTLAMGLVATAVWLGFVLANVGFSGSTQPVPSQDDTWQVWQPGKAESLVAEGRVVLVDVTADWCLTCKANKIFVLNSETTRQALAAVAAIQLQADWTRQDDTILAYLASFDRYGIPFNVVYGPAAPHGIVLPELLSHASLRQALLAAQGTSPAQDS